MTKLLIATTVPATIRSFLLPFVHHFRSKGWRVDAMARGISSCSDCIAACDNVLDVNWSRNPLDPRNLLEVPRHVRDVVSREGYNLVHVHTPVASFVARYALRQLARKPRGGNGLGSDGTARHARHSGLRVVYTAHGFHFYRGGPRLSGTVYRSLERLAGNWTDYLVVINREDEQAAARFRLVSPDRLRYMPGIGVDTERYRPESVTSADVSRVRSELGLSDADHLFALVAEFIPRKRHRDALEAFARLNRPSAHLAFAGDGPLEADMRRLSERLGIHDRVHFLGFRRDIPAIMRAALATLLPSEQEGLPRSILESLCLGVTAIGCRIRGVTELLENGAGLLVPVGDIAAIAQAMAHLLDDPAAARERGERGRSAMAGYDVRRIIELHESLYSEALQ